MHPTKIDPADLDVAIVETGEPMLEWFRFAHLPADLQDTSAYFATLAVHVTREFTRSAERSVTLRKLLEGKDAAVRCALEKRAGAGR